jgi:ribulose-5-phosphate 4-epimerase/fuculose-1-phosphate aldolase
MDLTPNAAELKPAHISDAEWALRVQLAHCYHLVDFFGWTETIFNHISARLPGTDHYLVNPFGLNYDEVTPANLLGWTLTATRSSPRPTTPTRPASRCTAPSTVPARTSTA